MDLAVTGGGTGGHIFPALAVGRYAAEDGATFRYLGSARGQEMAICRSSKIDFTAFDSAPLYSMKSVDGWISLIRLIRAAGQAKRHLRTRRPDVIFSTGGYAAAPVVEAARSLRIPFVIHESNSVPGRSNLRFVNQSRAFTCTFESTRKYVPKAERTGQPIRKELRDAAAELQGKPAVERDTILGLGGSQGSTFINKAFVDSAAGLPKERFVLATGTKNFINVDRRLKEPDAPKNVQAVSFLNLPDLVDTYSRAMVAVCRSGGTVAELAMFGVPSVLIPLPTSSSNHQLVNAEEMEQIGGAVVLQQKTASTPDLVQALTGWINDSARRETAHRALQSWDVPDATERVYDKLKAATGRHTG